MAQSPRLCYGKDTRYFPGMQGEEDSFLGGNECFLLFLPNLYLYDFHQPIGVTASRTADEID